MAVKITYNTFFNDKFLEEGAAFFDSEASALTVIAKWNTASSPYSYVITLYEKTILPRNARRMDNGFYLLLDPNVSEIGALC